MSACSSIVLPPGGTSIVNETVPVVAKSSAPIAVPSGLVPNLKVAATSAGNTARSGTLVRTDPAAPRPRPAVAVAAAAAPSAVPGAPRPGTGARVMMRGLRQMTTGDDPDVGFTSANVRKTFTAPGMTAGPR